MNTHRHTCACVLSCVWLFASPRTVARQAPLSMGFPRQEYCSELPFPSSGDLPDPGIEPTSPTLASSCFTTEPLEKPSETYRVTIIFKQKIRSHYLKSISLLITVVRWNIWNYDYSEKSKVVWKDEHGSSWLKKKILLLKYSWFRCCASLCCTSKWLSYIHIYMFFFLFNLLILAVLGLRCYPWVFSSCSERKD